MHFIISISCVARYSYLCVVLFFTLCVYMCLPTCLSACQLICMFLCLFIGGWWKEMCRYIHAPLQTYKKERGGRRMMGRGVNILILLVNWKKLTCVQEMCYLRTFLQWLKKSILIVMLYVHYLISALLQPCQGSLHMSLGDEILILFMEMWWVYLLQKKNLSLLCSFIQ